MENSDITGVNGSPRAGYQMKGLTIMLAAGI